MGDNHVRVCVRLRQEDGWPAGESLWAIPVDAGSGGGTYRLDNDLLFAPLRRGDVVRCELDGNSHYQVVEVVSLVDGILCTVTHPSGTDRVVKPMLESLIDQGVGVTRGIADGVIDLLVPHHLIRDGRLMTKEPFPDGWRIAEACDRDGRAFYINQDVNFELDTTSIAPQGPIDYWAPDDPGWQELGITDPDVLAYIQVLAASDARVLATIEADRRRDVLTYLERLSIEDPRDLPPLDGPLLVEPSA